MNAPTPASPLDDAITALDQALQSAAVPARELAAQCAEARGQLRALVQHTDSINSRLADISDQAARMSAHLSNLHATSPAHEKEGTP